MRLRERVQGFTIGAAVMGALMIGLPALTAPNSPNTDMDELAATFGVEIVWTNVSTCTPLAPEIVGCFVDWTPSRIYVSPDLSPEYTHHVVLHEIGHVLQSRLGLPVDECDADKFATSMGSSRSSYHCGS